MGIPKYYRWLSERYPLCIKEHSSSTMPEIDNLYIDINGIIHNASHSNDLQGALPYLLPGIQPDKIQIAVFKYLELLFQLVRPRKVYYIAIDGVAPRAKMNNQRERRYRSANAVQDFISESKKKGIDVTNEYFDSNCISPGTQFMLDMNRAIEFFIKYKIMTDDAWKSIDVVFSGVDVPGEGEHKIMSFMREHRGPANTRHCIYGLDADLIMLALLSHEQYVIILREQVKFGRQRAPERRVVGEAAEFVLLYINVFREYLRAEFAQIPDFERFVNDYVLICFLVGNDFIPRLPSFEISTGSLEFLFAHYKEHWNGYLTEGPYIVWETFEKFLGGLVQHETENIKSQIFNNKKRKRQAPVVTERVKPEMSTFWDPEGASRNKRVAHGALVEIAPGAEFENTPGVDKEEAKTETITVESLDSYDMKQASRRLKTEFSKGMESLKQFYYNQRLNLGNYHEDLNNLKYEYLRGLQWVMLYYFKGCQDWRWYFPYYYAPFVSDMTNFTETCPVKQGQEMFEYREPYLPVQQLMAILPPQSITILPEVYRGMMFSPRLIDFYPQIASMEYDPISEQMNWHSLRTILPFIDHNVLFEEMKHIEYDDPERNRQTVDSVHRYNPTQPTMVTMGISGLPDAIVRAEVTLLPYSHEKCFDAFLPVGTTPLLAGWPSLFNIAYESLSPKHLAINIHGTASRSESFVVQMSNKWDTIEGLYESSKNRPVYADYPVQHLCRVVAVSNKYKMIPHPSPDQLFKRYGFQSYQEFWNRTSQDLLEVCLTKLAIQLEIENIVHIQYLIRYRRSAYGIMYPEWSTEEAFVPEQLLMRQRDPAHHQEPLSYALLLDEFIPGTKVVLLKDDMYGGLAEIKGMCDDKFSDQGGLLVEVLSLPKQIDMKNQVREYNEEFVRAADIARDLGVNRNVVETLTGSINLAVRMETELFHLQFGLNFTHYMQGYQLRGISRWAPYFDSTITNGWDFSREAEVVIKNYYAQFSKFWKRLEEVLRNKRRSEVDFDLKQLFGYSASHFKQEALRVAMWVSQQSTSKQAWFPCESEQLSKDIISNLRKRINSVKSISTPINHELRVLKTNPGLVFRQTTPWSMLYFRESEYRLGDRVVNLNSQKTRYVSFGAEGTVTAYAGNMVEILWDEDLIGSHSCEMERQDLLNLTNRIERASLRRNATQDKRPDFNSKYIPDGPFVPEIKEKKIVAPEKIPHPHSFQTPTNQSSEGSVFEKLIKANFDYNFVPSGVQESGPSKVPSKLEEEDIPSPDFLMIKPIDSSTNQASLSLQMQVKQSQKMGIAKFYRWLSERYPLISAPYNQNSFPQPHWFYIDLNQILHLFWHEIAFELQTADREIIWPAIIRKTITYISQLFDMVLPTKTIIIAWDGVAPLAKMPEQRISRFEKSRLKFNDFFCSSAISPGTEFVQEFKRQVLDWLHFIHGKDSRWSGVKVMFSGADVPGEGEHKIIAEMRESQWSRHWIYSSDADLILLGLLTPHREVTILKETPEFKKVSLLHRQNTSPYKNFSVVYLNVLREYLADEFIGKQAEPDLFLSDYTLLSFFLGNDFLPPLPNWGIHKNTLELLLEQYKDWQGGYLTTRDGEIDFKNLMLFLGNMKSHEKFLIEIWSSAPPKQYDDLEIEPTIKYPELSQFFYGDYESGVNSLREFYYYTQCRLENSTTAVEDMWEQYTKTMQWALTYYLKGCPDWQWRYEPNFPPWLSDIVAYTPSQACWPKNQPLPASAQLLMTVTQNKAHLLPAGLETIVNSLDLWKRMDIVYNMMYETANWISVRMDLEPIPIQPILNTLENCGLDLSVVDAVGSDVILEASTSSNEETQNEMPSLSNLDHLGSYLDKNKVNIHGTTSFNTSLVYWIPAHDYIRAHGLLDQFVKIIPTGNIAKVTHVTSDHSTFPELTNREQEGLGFEEGSGNTWASFVMKSKQTILSKYGLDVDSTAFVHVYDVEEQSVDFEGWGSFKYAKKPRILPQELVVKEQVPGVGRIRVGQMVLAKRGMQFSSLGIVKSLQDRQVKVEVLYKALDNPIDLQAGELYMPLTKLAQVMQVTREFLQVICGSLIVPLSDRRDCLKVQLGLNLIWAKSHKVVKGVSRESTDDFELARLGIQLCQAYKNRWPHLWSWLHLAASSMEFGLNRSLNRMYKQFKRQDLKELGRWIEQLPTVSLTWISSSSQIVNGPVTRGKTEVLAVAEESTFDGDSLIFEN